MQEAIEFDMPKILQETQQLLVSYFQFCAEANPEFLCYIPNKEFVEILKQDNLNINDEYSLLTWVKYYFKHHDDHAVEVFADAREMAGEEVWARLTTKEKEAREAAAKKLVTDAELAHKKALQKDKDDFHQIQVDMDNELW